jgi:hypothetical protein
MKKIILQVILFIGIVCCNLLSANSDYDGYIEFSVNEVFIPERLGDIKLYKDCDGFHIIKNDQIYDVQNCFCDQMLRKMSNEQLMAFLGRDRPRIVMVTPEIMDQINEDDIIEVTGEEKEELISKLFGGGYISVSQMSDGEYSLQAKIRLRGGVFWDLWNDIKVYIIPALGVATSIIILAAVGAVIGAIVAGPKGAIIGTVIGGSAGLVIGMVEACKTSRGENTAVPAHERASEPEAAPAPVPERVVVPVPERAPEPTPARRRSRRKDSYAVPQIHNPFRDPPK